MTEKSMRVKKVMAENFAARLKQTKSTTKDDIADFDR